MPVARGRAKAESESRRFQIPPTRPISTETTTAAPQLPEAKRGKVQNLQRERTSVEEFAANPPPVPLVFVVAAGAGQVEQDSAETGLSEMSLHNVLMGWCLNLLGLLSVSFGFHRVHQQSERNLTGGGGRATRRANTLENLALAHKSRKARQEQTLPGPISSFGSNEWRLRSNWDPAPQPPKVIAPEAAAVAEDIGGSGFPCGVNNPARVVVIEAQDQRTHQEGQHRGIET